MSATFASAEGRTAIITGAAGSLGQAIVKRLLEREYFVVAIDRDRRVRELFSGVQQMTPILGNLGCSEGIDDVLDQLGASLENVGVLVNNAGILSNHKLADTTVQEWREVLAINLDAAFLLAQRCIPPMRRRRFGRVVNMCSLAMKTGGITAGTAYAVSKGALGALTFSLARETAGDGITVNAVAPAYVVSPMITEGLTNEQRQALLATIPVGRFCEPEEVAHAVDFLVSPLAGFITGEILDINGGLHLD